MIKIIPIASGSSGNCYYIKDNKGSIIIELGISWKNKILPAIDFKASNLDFALVTHRHQDHSKSVKDALSAGIDVGMNSDTAEFMGVQDHHRVMILKAGEQKNIGPWSVLPYSCQHDVPTLGFLISNGSECLLYLTDTGYSINRFSGITHIMVECNHLESKLSENILNGNLPAVAGRRIRRNHLSLERLITMLRSNDLSKCREIHLLHLSDGNSDEKRMIQTVEEQTGIPCYACGE